MGLEARARFERDQQGFQALATMEALTSAVLEGRLDGTSSVVRQIRVLVRGPLAKWDGRFRNPFLSKNGPERIELTVENMRETYQPTDRRRKGYRHNGEWYAIAVRKCARRLKRDYKALFRKGNMTADQMVSGK